MSPTWRRVFTAGGFTLGTAMVVLLAVIAYALLSDGGDSVTSGQEAGTATVQRTPTSPSNLLAAVTPQITPRVTATPQCPQATPCPTCPQAETCPECATCPQVTCPQCPTCPTCPEPVSCPQCPACPSSTQSDLNSACLEYSKLDPDNSTILYTWCIQCGGPDKVVTSFDPSTFMTKINCR